MNTAPMYKNIVTSAQKVYHELEKNLKEEFSEEASILERLTELSNEFSIESKNARIFDEVKTTNLFNKLAEFYKSNKNFTKITQYELCKSKLIHSLHCFLSLPIKEEESKSSEKGKTKEIPKNSDEYLTILSRYLCFVSVFNEGNNPKVFKNLISTFENSIKVSFTNHFSQELNAYHDGLNLAYDLKKYSKRNKLQLVYSPNILKKFEEDEIAEKGACSYAGAFKASIPSKKPAKIYKGEGFEDQDFMQHFPEPKLDKFISKKEKKEDPLVEEINDEDLVKSTKEQEGIDHSSVFLKRDALYKELKIVNVSVENSSTLEVIKDFLRNKINNKEQVNNLKRQSTAYSSTHKMAEILERARRHYDKNEDGSGEPGEISKIIQKMAMETLKETGEYSSMNQEDRLSIFKDLESLMGGAPPSMEFKVPSPKESKSKNLFF